MDQKKRLILLLSGILILVSALHFFVTFTLTGTATVSTQGEATICINPPPVITAIPNQAATEGVLYTYQVVATDEGDTLTFYDNTTLFNINQSGYISFTPANANIGAYYINITVEENSTCDTKTNDTAIFLLTIAAAPPSEAAAAPSSAGGGGAAVSVPPLKPISFQVSEEIVKVALKKSRSLQKRIVITNDGGEDLLIDIINPLEGIVSVSPSSIVVSKGEKKEIILLFNGLQNLEPEVYSGIIALEGKTVSEAKGARTITKEITIVLEIESEEVIFDASIDLLKKTLLPGEQLSMAVTIFNPRRVFSAPVTVIYTISDLKGNIVYEEKETLTLEEQVSFAKTFSLPASILPGQYLVALKVISLDSFATSTELFTIQSSAVPAIVGLALPSAERPFILFFLPFLLVLVVIILIVLYLIQRRLKKSGMAVAPRILQQMQQMRSKRPATIVRPTTIIKRKTIISPSISPSIIIRPKAIMVKGDEGLRRKLFLLHQGYKKGYISETTYKKTKATLMQMLRKK